MTKTQKFLTESPSHREILFQRISAKIAKSPAGCWEWTGTKNRCGYGMVWLSVGLRNEGAHRAMYVLVFGELPEGLIVMHKCDNPACVNPDHLKAGTNAENAKDAAIKGRTFRSIGSKSGKAKLTEGLALQAMRLVAAGSAFKEVAARFGVSHFCLRRVKDGSRWPHLQKAVRQIFQPQSAR